MPITFFVSNHPKNNEEMYLIKPFFNELSKHQISFNVKVLEKTIKNQTFKKEI